MLSTLHGRRLLSLIPLGLAFVLGVLWALVEIAPPSDGSTTTVPVAPGRAVYVVTWSRERMFIDKEFNHSAITSVSNARTVAFWFQDNRVGSARRLLTLRLVSWPLLAAAGCSTALAVGLARRPKYLQAH